MLPTTRIELNLEEKALREYIKEQLDKQIQYKIVLVDKNRLAQKLINSIRY